MGALKLKPIVEQGLVLRRVVLVDELGREVSCGTIVAASELPRVVIYAGEAFLPETSEDATPVYRKTRAYYADNSFSG